MNVILKYVNHERFKFKKKINVNLFLHPGFLQVLLVTLFRGILPLRCTPSCVRNQVSWFVAFGQCFVVYVQSDHKSGENIAQVTHGAKNA